MKSTEADEQKTTIQGLKPFTSYSLLIVAFNSVGEGPESETITFRTLERGKNSFYFPVISSYIIMSGAFCRIPLSPVLVDLVDLGKPKRQSQGLIHIKLFDFRLHITHKLNLKYLRYVDQVLPKL